MLKSDKLLFGAAYYAEYMPYNRIDTDFKLMQEAGMNVIRIGESTWSTWEPEDGKFDFSLLIEMLEKARENGLSVIVGTPTYAIPSWLAEKYPDILADTRSGKSLYGHRQLMDITNPDYLRHCERIIRQMMMVCTGYDNIIGYQVDNETRSGDGMSTANQKEFAHRMETKYNGDIEAFNLEFGLDYWSNRISSWGAFPDLRGTINGSLSAAYKAYLRDRITEFLSWQASIVREYATADQFVTQNFDYSWKDYSFGIQPLVNQKAACADLDVAGCDIYHLSQDNNDGAMIAFGGSVARSLKKDNYFVLETQSQGRVGWSPYPGQLRLDAYSHLSSGANMLEYWCWHSIHNSMESYWKGILSHDLLPNEIYRELAAWKAEITPIENHLLNLTKNCEAAILVDNRSLTALDEFPLNDTDPSSPDYNTILRNFHDALYRINIETDLVYCDDDWSKYKMLVVPALYSASSMTISKLRHYVKNGGHLVLGFRSLMADEELKLYSDPLPCGMTDILGLTYDRFTFPADNCKVTLKDTSDNCLTQTKCHDYIELIRPQGCDILASYDHPVWNAYACITTNTYGAGRASYIGCNLATDALSIFLGNCAAISNIARPSEQFPLIIKSGTNSENRQITYVFNYSATPRKYVIPKNATRLLSCAQINAGEEIEIEGWGVEILES